MAVLLANDFWYMHLYSKDEDFDKSHKLTEEYFSRLYYDADALMEFTVQEGYPVINPNDVKNAFTSYTIENNSEYSYFDIVARAREKLSVYIEILREVRNFTTKSNIQSKLDSMLELWDKELNYKLARRTPTPSMLNGFINTGLDNVIAYSVGR